MVPFVTFAQDDDAKPEKDKKKSDKFKWEIGINAGVNLTNLVNYDGSEDTENNVGRLYGVTLIYHASPFFSIKTDLDFENKGWTIRDFSLTGGSGSSIEDINQNLDYFNVPLFMHLGFGKLVKFDINLGTYVGVLIKDNAFYISDGGEEVEVKDAFFGGYKSLDFGLTYGVGVDYVFSKRFSFGFDFLVEQGLTNIKNRWKNRSFDFDFGINYMFGRKK